jgi:hypothetical protein
MRTFGPQKHLFVSLVNFFEFFLIPAYVRMAVLGHSFVCRLDFEDITVQG